MNIIKIKRVVEVIALISTLVACGGGSSNGGTVAISTPTPTATPTATPTTAASFSSVSLAQSMVFPSDDAQSVQVANKDVMVLVQLVTTDVSQAKPTGTLIVLDSEGRTLQTTVLTQPSGALLTAATSTPSLVTHYSANIDAVNVVPNIRLELSLASGQLTKELIPRVGTGNKITLVRVPINITGVTGQVSDQVGDALKLRAPIAQVSSVERAVYTSSVSPFPADETAWGNAMEQVLGELDALRISDNADALSHYVGFLPKTTYGIVGLAYKPGTSAVVAGFTANDPVVLETVVHEIGHNLSLSHAPCGNPADVDPNYPYANANLGAVGRYIWGFRPAQKVFIDTTNTDLHDIMSYCASSSEYSFSDYNYRLIQKYMTPQDADLVSPSTKAADVRTVSQEVLLLSGTLSNGQLKLRPLKRFDGFPNGTGQGSFTARLTTAAGVSEVLFDVKALDHRAQSSGFAFAVPNPGVLTDIEILRNGQSLLIQHVTRTKALPPQGVAANITGVVQATERNNSLTLQWDSSAYPFLTVAHIGAQRTTLAFDLKQGSVSLPLRSVPAGGMFEFILSDGINSTRVFQAR